MEEPICIENGSHGLKSEVSQRSEFPPTPFDEFRKNILKGGYDAIEALKTAKDVLATLTSDDVVNDFVPFLLEHQTQFDSLMLAEACEIWCNISKILSVDRLVHVFKGLEFLATKEDPGIRDGAINAIVSVLDEICVPKHSHGTNPPSQKTIKALLVDQYVVPMINRLSQRQFFASEMSACKLIPKVYKLATEESQSALRQFVFTILVPNGCRAFQQLCETSYLIVKITAARNLILFITMIDMEHAISMFWLVLKNMSVELQEEVRSCAVEACLEFSKRCTSEQNESLNYPVIKAAAEDGSWKVRKSVALLFHKVYQVFGEDQVYEHLLDLHMALLNDVNDNVKQHAIEDFSKWADFLSLKSIERYIPTLDSLAKFSSLDARRHICSILALFSSKITPEDSKRILYPTMNYFFNHTCIDVRLLVVRHIHLVCDGEDFYNGFGDKLLETIDIALQGPQWRHRRLLARHLSDLYNHFGADIFCENFVYTLFRLLVDTVWQVRDVLLSSLEKICDKCGVLWVYKVVLPELTTLYMDPQLSPYVTSPSATISYSARISVLQALSIVASLLDVEVAIKEVVPIFCTAAQDPIPNVRIVASKALERIVTHHEHDDPLVFYTVKCTLTTLLQDPDPDVRHFSQLALDAYTLAFEDDEYQ